MLGGSELLTKNDAEEESFLDDEKQDEEEM